jgi:hypothetical protein
MNNPSNNPRHFDPSNPSKNPHSNEYFLRQQERPDLNMPNKQDSKLDIENFNDIFMSNLLRNPGSLNQFFDKGPQNTDFFNPGGSNPQNFPLDLNLLYNFPNVGGGPKNVQSAGPNDSLNQNNLYFPNMGNMGNMGGNFLIPHNIGLNNQSLYDDFMKNQNPNQLEMNEKGHFNPNMLPDNQGLIDNQFLMQSLDEFNFKPQDVGQGPNQPNNMGGLGNFPNQMLFNNLAYSGDLGGLNSLLLPSGPNFNLEELYNLQMQGGVPPGSLQHNIGGIPMDLKVENSTQPQQRPQNQQNYPPSMRNPRQMQESVRPGSRGGEQKPQGNFPNPQDINLLNGMQGKPMGMGGNLGMLNFPMQSLILPNDLEPQSNLLKYIAGGMDHAEAGKMMQQNSLNTNKEQQNSGSNDDPKRNTNINQDMMKSAGFMNPNDIDLMSRGYLDPFMANSASFKDGKGSILDSLGFEEPGFLDSHTNLYNRMKEKNKYERSLKIERYKNKKRNWAKKISYDCRKRVADTRLRIKGRFISKKDSEKIQQLVGKQEDAFNEKKNLNLDYLTSKFNISDENDNDVPVHPGKPYISKGYLLGKIDEILHNNKNPLPPKNLAYMRALADNVKSKLMSRSKKIFKIRNRGENSGLMKQEMSATSSLNQMPMRQPFNPNMMNRPNMVGGYPGGFPNMQQQMNAQGLDNNPRNFHNNEYLDNAEIDPNVLANMNMLDPMSFAAMGMNMGMGMGMGPYENRPDIHHQEDNGQNIPSRFK